MPPLAEGVAPRTIALCCDPDLYGDAIFDPDNPRNHLGSFDCWIAARPALEALGWRLHTQDAFEKSGEIPEITLLQGIPRGPLRYRLGKWYGKTRPWVFLWEAFLVSPQNWKIKKHQDYEVLFTWDSRLVDNKRYFPVCAVPQKFRADFIINRDLSKKTGLVTMIAGHKRRGHPQELYSARVEAIRWYEQNHPEAFDLYGQGWNEAAVRGADRLRRLGLLKPLSRLMVPESRPSYRGAIPNKKPVLEKYRFAISYENVQQVRGYITEKIFDPFLAGSVPIYWGAPDITAYVPKDCFIDYRDYGDQAALFERLSTMRNDEYLNYLDRIERFIRSQADGPFGLSFFVKTFLAAINARQT